MKTLVQGVGSLLGYGQQGGNETYDPLEIITIARLAFMPVGTKCIFHQYSIELHKPSYGQKVYRTLDGSSHKDLDRFKKIIKSAIAYYHPKQDTVICEIFKYTLRGLEQLKNTYHDVPGVDGNIQSMMMTITANLPSPPLDEAKPPLTPENGASGSTKKKKPIEHAEEKSTETAKTAFDLHINEMSENELDPVIKKIKAIWKKTDLEEILGWLKEADFLQAPTPLNVEEKANDQLLFIQTLQTHKNERFKYEVKKACQIPL